MLHIQPILFTWVLKTLPVNPLTSKVDYHGLGLWTCSWFLNSYATHRPCLEIKTKSFLWTMHLRAFKNLALVLQVFWGYLWSPMFTTSLRNILFITHIYGNVLHIFNLHVYKYFINQITNYFLRSQTYIIFLCSKLVKLLPYFIHNIETEPNE